jgi:hypothetical protein
LIGNYSGNLDEPFSGVIDEVALYSAALSPAEVRSHWQCARNRRGYFSDPSESNTQPSKVDQSNH